MQESCSVQSGTSQVCTPGVYTALQIRLLLSAHIQSEQMNLCVSVFYPPRQEAGNSASEVDLSIFPEIFGYNEVLHMFCFSQRPLVTCPFELKRRQELHC